MIYKFSALIRALWQQRGCPKCGGPMLPDSIGNGAYCSKCDGAEEAVLVERLNDDNL